MTLKEFVDKYTGKEVDFDGFYGTQCMDLMHQYVYDVLGLKDKTILAAKNAKTVFQQFRWGMYFDRIDNTPYAVPERGDIIFWGGGEHGHVAIVLESNVHDFISFDANYPLGTLPHKQFHNYDNVLGWVRFKGEYDSQVPILEEVIEGLESKLEALEAKYKECQEKSKIFKKETEKTIKDMEERIVRLQNLKGEDMDKKVLWESIKEPLRLLVLAIIPFAVSYLTGLDYVWAGVATVVLRGLDKYLHNLGKESGKEVLTKGITRF